MTTRLRQEKQRILDSQVEWAQRHSTAQREGAYFADPRSNMPWLTPAIRAEIEEGDGAEFGSGSKPGKICALHSSSALAVNFFGYWHDRPAGAIRHALGLGSSTGSLRFEQKFATGVGPRSPNLDVVFECEGEILAIESKFTEWLGASGRKGLRDAYLPKGKEQGLWASKGLPGAQSVAEGLATGKEFSQLDAPQLLKHMLGLANTCVGSRWRLLLVWYGPGSEASRAMQREIDLFRERLGEDARRFDAMTYHALWKRLQPRLAGNEMGYERYIRDRYFTT